MRKIKIDDKWSFECIDVNSDVMEGYAAPITYRYGEVLKVLPTNLEVAMAQRIMELEDKLKVAREALKLSADSGSICSDVSEEALEKINE